MIRILSACLALASSSVQAMDVVLQNGRSIPISSLSLEGEKFVVKTAVEGFNPGQAFPLSMADHIYGDKPVEIKQATALLLSGKPQEAQKLLLPVVNELRMTAKIPGNFWITAARTLFVAYAVNNDSADAAELGKEIGEATPAQGIDPFVLLGKALMLPVLTTKYEDREMALANLTTDNLPADLCAYASFYRGNLLRKQKKDTEALEAYLAVPCLFPSGGLILNAAAELEAADLLAALGRREEALALVKSALRVSDGTVLAEEAAKRLASLK